MVFPILKLIHSFQALKGFSLRKSIFLGTIKNIDVIPHLYKVTHSFRVSKRGLMSNRLEGIRGATAP